MIPSSASGLRLAAATAAGSGSPGGHEVADRRVQRDHGPGQRRRAGEGHALADDLDLEAADPAAPVARPGEGHRVADEHQPCRRAWRA